MKFQLTASRRGWLSVFSTSKTILVFQLTASRRGWRHSIKSIVFCLIISTHSLTKRLTTLLVSVAFRYVKFQLTASRRGWRFPELILNYLIAFQLTASRRGWQGADGKSSYTWIFQLTASRRGWHLLPYIRIAPMKYFNSQPHEEADWAVNACFLIDSYFNSQPHEEADVPQTSSFSE